MMIATSGEQPNFVAQGGEGFEWDPEGVTFGIDFQTDRVFDGETVGSDFTTVFGGDFDPGEVSALGMALFDRSPAGHSPIAIGPLLTKLQSLIDDGGSLLFFWRQSFVEVDGYLLSLNDVDELAQGEIYYDGAGALYASARSGSYLEVGTVRSFSDNVLAVSHSPAGWLSSLNGATAVLDETATVADIVVAWVGQQDSSSWLGGWLKALIFYPATNAAGVEAYSANAAPVNTVAPAITGTAQEGQELSVSTGTWTGSPTSYEYQWYRGNFNGASAIGGATASTFTPTETEFGVFMKCIVYALNADGIGGIGVTDDETVIAA